MKPRYFFKYVVGTTGFESPGLVRALQNAYPGKSDIYVQVFKTGNPEPGTHPGSKIISLLPPGN